VVTIEPNGWGNWVIRRDGEVLLTVGSQRVDPGDPDRIDRFLAAVEAWAKRENAREKTEPADPRQLVIGGER
jgi:hypothetical protein